MLVHQLPTPGQARWGEVRPVRQDVPNPLVVDFIRPAGLEQVRQRQLHQEVAERGRVQDTGVIEDDVGHGSVAHIQILAQAASSARAA